MCMNQITFLADFLLINLSVKIPAHMYFNQSSHTINHRYIPDIVQHNKKPNGKLHHIALLTGYTWMATYELLNIIAGKITPRGNNENTAALLDSTEDELESVDYISILQPQLRPKRGN